MLPFKQNVVSVIYAETTSVQVKLWQQTNLQIVAESLKFKCNSFPVLNNAWKLYLLLSNSIELILNCQYFRYSVTFMQVNIHTLIIDSIKGRIWQKIKLRRTFENTWLSSLSTSTRITSRLYPFHWHFCTTAVYQIKFTTGLQNPRVNISISNSPKLKLSSRLLPPLMACTSKNV